MPTFESDRDTRAPIGHRSLGPFRSSRQPWWTYRERVGVIVRRRRWMWFDGLSRTCDSGRPPTVERWHFSSIVRDGRASAGYSRLSIGMNYLLTGEWSVATLLRSKPLLSLCVEKYRRWNEPAGKLWSWKNSCSLRYRTHGLDET